jgi:cobyrinic acid a,c-diamide synthase
MSASSTVKSSAFIIAGTHSGVGKTTVTLALARAIIRAGLSIQPFKIGPDFIDTAYHGESAGRDSINLDLWMMGAEHVKSTFSRFSAGADVALIEAMGALFDGEDGTERGSAAFLAKLLEVPIILIIDIWGMTRSAVPLLEGFLSFDRDLKFSGFVMNRAGSARHAQMVYQALPQSLQTLCLGHILRRDALEIPERHLGLITVDENVARAEARRAALDAAGVGLRIEHLLPSPRRHDVTTVKARLSSDIDRIRIAIARDPAFCFYYSENLALLEDAGAELCPFSPTSEPSLPSGVGGIYIGGGYPESFLNALASNFALKEQIRALAARGMPIYAECGGFMYLGRTLTIADRSAAPMVGLFPLDTLMDPEYLAIRYVTVRTIADSPLGPAGTTARGQEFHQSRIISPPSGTPMYQVTAMSGEQYEEGQLCSSAVGSYIHLHFASNRSLPRNFVENCTAWLHRQAQ